MNAYEVFLSPRLAIAGAVEQSCFVKEYYQKVFEKNPKLYIINVLVRCLNFFWNIVITIYKWVFFVDVFS